MPAHFPVLDENESVRHAIDLSTVVPGRTVVVETERALSDKRNTGYCRVLRWMKFEDGRSVATVPPGSGQAVSRVFDVAIDLLDPLDLAVAGRLRTAIDECLRQRGLPPVDQSFHDLCFACNGALLRRRHNENCRRLHDASIPPAEGILLPSECFPDGIAYGVVLDGAVVSVAFAHRFGLMEDRVAEIGVVTAPAFRNRGYAKTAVAAVVAHIGEKGCEARYTCAPDNAASVATAASVGFVPYGRSLVLVAPV